MSQNLNHYNIVSELGRGGMAAVYLAHDQKFDTNVAIKVLNKEFVNNENIRKRFLAEAKSMYRMSHPNIIKVTDLIDENDTVAFVMEHVDGETLKEYLERKGRLIDTEIKGLFTQMLDAVGYVHEQNLVHRDIKPSNFMLDRKGKVKLMDFGIAKTMDATAAEYTQTGTGLQMGTPMYMSPEQVKSSKDVAATSDIYSLGVLLWQMVSGKKPYDTGTLSTIEIQIKILQDTLTKLESPWNQFIERATRKECNERYKSCHELALDLNLFAAGSTSSRNFDETVFEENAAARLNFEEQVYKLCRTYLSDDSNVFLGKFMPEEKKKAIIQMCLWVLYEHQGITPLVYCEMSVFRPGIIGWAIVRTEEGNCYLLVSSPFDGAFMYTLNFRSDKFHYVTSIDFYGRNNMVMAINYEEYSNELWKPKVSEPIFMKSGKRYKPFFEALIRSR